MLRCRQGLWGFPKGPHDPFELRILGFRQRLFEPSHFLFSHLFKRLAVQFGDMKAFSDDLVRPKDLACGLHEALVQVGAHRHKLRVKSCGGLAEKGFDRRLFPVLQDPQDAESVLTLPRDNGHKVLMPLFQ